MKSVAVFYIYVPSFGVHAEAFNHSYRAYCAGIDHDLIVLVKSNSVPVELPPIPAVAWDAVGEGGWDIGPFLHMSSYYRDYDRLVLLGAYSRILCDDWLLNLVEAGPLASATGSWEVNPHLRTTGISFRPDLLDGIEAIEGEEDCWAFEHGSNNVYQRALRAGVRGVVVGRDGISYEERHWPISRTYRSGYQENLMIADNRTEEFAAGTEDHREALMRLAWSR